MMVAVIMWNKVKFSYLYLIPSRNGVTRPSSIRGSGYKMIGMGELFANDRIYDIPMELVPMTDKEQEKYDICVGDLLFARQSLVLSGAGKCSIVMEVPEYTTFESHIIRVRLDPQKAVPLFYYYYFKSPRSPISTIVEQSAQAGIRGSDLSELEVDLPPLPVQKKIAAILSSLDDKIAINTRMNKVLEETARALFHRWFVEFEFPNDEGKPYKSSGGRMIASEMGEIPEGWTIKRAQEICNISIGKTPPRKETQWFTSNSSDVKWISISDMGSSGMFVLDSSEYLTVDAIEKFNIVTVPKDTVILSFKLTIGRVSITSEDLVTNEAIAHFKTNIQELREYLYFTLKCYDYVSLGSTSSIATAINSKIIKNMNILLPHINLIKDYHALVLPIFEIIRTNQTEINQLKKIRETVLPKLMGGGIIS